MDVLGNLLVLASFVTGLMEWLKTTYLKPYFLKQYEYDPELGDQTYARVVQTIALAMSLFAVAVARFLLFQDVNPLTGTVYEFSGNAGVIAGVIAGGFLVFGGNDVIHQFFDRLQASTHQARLRAMLLAAQIENLPISYRQDSPPEQPPVPYRQDALG